jgi:thiol-disulfide isomerase/thioredoxin
MSPGCPHCEDTAPILARLHATYGTRVQFLTVAFDRDARRVRAFAQREKHSWPYLMGTQEVIDAYHLEGVPIFCLVAPDGRVLDVRVGSTSYESMRQSLETLLAAR